MKNVIKYPGSKWRIANWIISYFPEHKTYLELFFGGGAVFFNKPPSRIETINDISGEVVNYFRVLRDHPAELIPKLALTPFAREEYEKCFESTEDPVEQARRFAVRCCQGFGASNRYKNGWRSGIGSTAPFPPRYWNQLPKILQEASERLKEAQIENQEALRLIERYNHEDTFIYADPPYLLETRKSYIYDHEMTDEQHKELLEALLQFKGKVMISGYDSQMYNTMLKGWHKAKKSTLAENSSKRTEVIWMNYETNSQIKLEDI